MPQPENEPIDDLLAECCKALFTAYALDVERRSRDEFPGPEQLAFCAVMGFAGPDMRGALVLATTREPLETSNPGAERQRDWVCELANQLMGRIKNRLIGRNVEIHLATPAGLSGSNLSVLPQKLRSPQVFAVMGGYVCVWIDCELAPGFQVPRSAVAGIEPAMTEGETLLF